MKSFIFKCIGLGGVMVSLYFLGQYYLAKNYVDEYYSKFTHPASSLILGISRAHDGIVPQVLAENIDSNLIEAPILNFAFHLSHSPYGPVYYEAIKKKIKPDTKSGIFILSVTPGSLSIPSYLEDDSEKFSDQYSSLAKVNNMNSHPNYEYIRKNYGKALYKAFLDPELGIRKVHEDGWMEVDIHKKEHEITDGHVRGWKNEIVESYKSYEGFYKFSEVRFNSLNKTIKLLQEYGKVILVRIPLDKEVLDLENQFMSELDKRIEKLSMENNIPYFNYTKSKRNYESYDGAHLTKKGAISFTKTLSADINKYLRNPK